MASRLSPGNICLIYENTTQLDTLSIISIRYLGECPRQLEFKCTEARPECFSVLLFHFFFFPALSFLHQRTLQGRDSREQIPDVPGALHTKSSNKMHVPASTILLHVENRGCCYMVCSPDFFMQLLITQCWFHIKSFSGRSPISERGA